MWCTSLRQRPSFASLVPTLYQQSGLGLREDQLTAHDIAFPLETSNDTATRSSRFLRVLLLAAADVQDANLEAVVERIRRFSHLTAGQDIVAIFSFTPPRNITFQSAKKLARTADEEADTAGMLAYLRLQAILMDNVEIPNVPLLPLSTLGEFPHVLKKHAAILTGPRRQNTKPTSTDAYNLLTHCTANPPMREPTAFSLTDTFLDFQQLSEDCTAVLVPQHSSLASMQRLGVTTQTTNEEDSSGEYAVACGRLEQLRDLVGDEEYRSIISFWTDDQWSG